MSREDFDKAVEALDEAYKDSLRAFVTWCEKNWKHDTREQWRREEPWPGDDFELGWNKAIGGLRIAFECYTDERDFYHDPN